MLDWNDLRVFLAIARTRTLSAAARALDIDQSTVGRRLIALEAAAGTRLFDRSPMGYALTAAGESVLGNIEEIESHTIAMQRKLAGQDTRVEGIVRVATSDSLAAWFVVRHLPKLRASHPGIVIDLVTGNRTVDLARREAELSLRMSKPTQPNLIARRLGIAAWALYASEEYLAARGRPSTKSRWAGHDVVGFDSELAGTAGAKWLAERASRAQVVLRTNSMICYGESVAAGLGIGALPCVFGDMEPTLRRLPPGVFGHHDIWLVVHPDIRPSARVRAVFDYLTTLVQAEAPLLAGRNRSTARR